jgi:hypothetical protein
MRISLLKTAALAALALVLSACTPAAPDPSYDSSGGWVGQICRSGECEPVAFVLVDQGGSSSQLNGETIVMVDGEPDSLGV